MAICQYRFGIQDKEQSDTSASEQEGTSDETKTEIEEALNRSNNEEVTGTYSADADAWVMSIATAVDKPEIAEDQGVSVAIPGAYTIGINTDGDGMADVTADSYEEAVNGTLVVDDEATVTSENGQVYPAATAPVIINTGAAGYSEQSNHPASTANRANGYQCLLWQQGQALSPLFNQSGTLSE